MLFSFSVSDLLQQLHDKTESYCVPMLIVSLIFIGPLMCKWAARLTRALPCWFIKFSGLTVACGAMAAANISLYQWLGDDYGWSVWAQDTFFVLFMLNWLRTPLLHLRAGSADALDDKIERLQNEGWDAKLFRWIPSMGVHRVLLAKRTSRKTGPVALPPHLLKVE